jgi:hypothetical protein
VNLISRDNAQLFQTAVRVSTAGYVLTAVVVLQYKNQLSQNGWSPYGLISFSVKCLIYWKVHEGQSTTADEGIQPAAYWIFKSRETMNWRKRMPDYSFAGHVFLRTELG